VTNFNNVSYRSTTVPPDWLSMPPPPPAWSNAPVPVSVGHSFSPAPQPMRFRSATPQMQASSYSYGSMPPPPAPGMMAAPMPMQYPQAGYEQAADPSYGTGFVQGWPEQVNGVADEGNDSYEKSYEAVEVPDPNGWQASA
jgi:hypothetical protein